MLESSLRVPRSGLRMTLAFQALPLQLQGHRFATEFRTEFELQFRFAMY